ncbi:MAG: aminoacyl-histidine dipeptidase [Bacteroidales bacterium]
MRNTKLQPEIVWHFFDEITRIPRPSKKEEQISAYLKHFAKNNHLECKEDEVGNLLIVKAATDQTKARPTIVLQCHMDMVCEKNESVNHDFEKDPIRTFIDGDWVKAEGTTLGADNGAGMAAALALLASDELKHGRIEALFTVDEETGLNGAFGLQSDFFEGKYLLNLDGEDGIYIGCAGGIDTKAIFEFELIDAPKDKFYFRVSVSGLAGGHSGDDINKGRANAILLLTRYLQLLQKKYDLVISEIEGGNLHNAIPRSASAYVGVGFRDKENVRIDLNHFIYEVENEFGFGEPKIRIDLDSEDRPETCIDRKSAKNLLNALYICPNGVIAMNPEFENLVETSSNLASVKRIDVNRIQVVISHRSSVESAKLDICYRIDTLFTSIGAKVFHGKGYPGWKPNLQSPLLNISVQAYEDLFNEKPYVRAVHAGLECGLFLDKYPYLDMISFGPTILDAHSPDERLSISGMQKFWKHLNEIIARL